MGTHQIHRLGKAAAWFLPSVGFVRTPAKIGWFGGGSFWDFSQVEKFHARMGTRGRDFPRPIFQRGGEKGRHLDLLAAGHQLVDRDARDTGHLHQVDDNHELVDQPQRQQRVLWRAAKRVPCCVGGGCTLTSKMQRIKSIRLTGGRGLRQVAGRRLQSSGSKHLQAVHCQAAAGFFVAVLQVCWRRARTSAVVWNV